MFVVHCAPFQQNDPNRHGLGVALSDESDDYWRRLQRVITASQNCCEEPKRMLERSRAKGNMCYFRDAQKTTTLFGAIGNFYGTSDKQKRSRPAIWEPFSGRFMNTWQQKNSCFSKAVLRAQICPREPLPEWSQTGSQGFVQVSEHVFLFCTTTLDLKPPRQPNI